MEWFKKSCFFACFIKTDRQVFSFFQFRRVAQGVALLLKLTDGRNQPLSAGAPPPLTGEPRSTGEVGAGMEKNSEDVFFYQLAAGTGLPFGSRRYRVRYFTVKFTILSTASFLLSITATRHSPTIPGTIVFAL